MLRVTLIGNLGADPEMRFTAKGTGLVTFRVAVNSVRVGPEGERQENTEWFRVRLSRNQEWASRLTKGSRVLVIGRLDIGRYQTREGETRTSFDVWADEVQAMGARTLAPGQPEGAMDAAPEAPEPVPAGVSSLPPRAERASGGNGRARGAERGAASAEASSEANELEDLPF
jgi:single-strand DNA-binding protein